MARHRSPRGRRAYEVPTAQRRPAPTVRRSVSAVSSFPGPLGSTPVRRGGAAVAITGGVLSMMGAASPAALPQVAEAATVTALPQQAGVDQAGPLLRPSVLPVAPDPDVLDDASPLVKAVQMAQEQLARAEAERAAAEEAQEQARAEVERAEAEARAAAEEAEDAVEEGVEEVERSASVGGDCGISTSSLGAVKSHVREAAEFLGCLFGQPTMIGVAGRSGTSDHPSGRALDLMVTGSTGDAVAECALRNQDALGVKYVIWEQRINHGSGWEGMADRGGVTANHFDHVHISFDDAGSRDLSGC